MEILTAIGTPATLALFLGILVEKGYSPFFAAYVGLLAFLFCALLVFQMYEAVKSSCKEHRRTVEKEKTVEIGEALGDGGHTGVDSLTFQLWKEKDAAEGCGDGCKGEKELLLEVELR